MDISGKNKYCNIYVIEGFSMALNDLVTICSNPNCNMGYLFKPDQTPTKDVCGKCGAPLIHTPLTAEENFLIERVSKDRNFLLAMIELKKNDIIEFETKISIYREQAKKDGCYGKPKNIAICPKCGSTSITAGQRGFSLLTGFIGSGKTVNRCANCGYKWKP